MKVLDHYQARNYPLVMCGQIECKWFSYSYHKSIRVNMPWQEVHTMHLGDNHSREVLRAYKVNSMQHKGSVYLN